MQDARTTTTTPESSSGEAGTEDSDSDYEHFAELLDECVGLAVQREAIDARLKEKKALLLKIMGRRQLGQTVKELLNVNSQQSISHGSGSGSGSGGSAAAASAQGDPSVEPAGSSQGSGESAATASAEGDAGMEPASESPRCSSEQNSALPPLPSRWLTVAGLGDGAEAAESRPSASLSSIEAEDRKTAFADTTGARVAEAAIGQSSHCHEAAPAMAAARLAVRAPAPDSNAQPFCGPDAQAPPGEWGTAAPGSATTAAGQSQQLQQHQQHQHQLSQQPQQQQQQQSVMAQALARPVCAPSGLQEQRPPLIGAHQVRPLPERDRPLPVLRPGVTTLAVRKIPHAVSQAELLEEFPVDGTYDFLHCPYSAAERRSLGLAFINFLTPELAVRFLQRWHGRKLSCHATATSLVVEESRNQGLTAQLEMVRCDAPVLPVVVLGGERQSAQRVSELIGQAKIRNNTWRV